MISPFFLVAPAPFIYMKACLPSTIRATKKCLVLQRFLDISPEEGGIPENIMARFFKIINNASKCNIIETMLILKG